MLHNRPLTSIMTSSTHLDVIRSQNDPPTEAVAQVDDSHTAAEANDTGEGGPERHDQDLWESTRWNKESIFTNWIRDVYEKVSWVANSGWQEKVQFQWAEIVASQLELVKLTYVVFLEEREVADDSDPHEERGGSQQDGTQVVRWHVLWWRDEQMVLLNAHHRDAIGKRETCTHTLDSIPILMTLPVTVKMSLMIRRMYQPLMNSRRSDQHTLRPRVSRKYCTYS